MSLLENMQSDEDRAKSQAVAYALAIKLEGAARRNKIVQYREALNVTADAVCAEAEKLTDAESGLSVPYRRIWPTIYNAIDRARWIRLYHSNKRKLLKAGI